MFKDLKIELFQSLCLDLIQSQTKSQQDFFLRSSQVGLKIYMEKQNPILEKYKTQLMALQYLISKCTTKL